MKDKESLVDPATEFTNRASKAQKVQAVLNRFPWISSAVVLAISLITFSFFNENFLTPNNLSLILQQVAIIGAIAAGQTIIIMAKTSFVNGWPAWASFLLGIMVGTAAGAFNGWLVTRIKLPPFIVTLATLNIFLALTLFYATGRTIMDQELDPFYLKLGYLIKIGEFNVTTGVLVMLAMYIVLAFVLRYTGWGRHVYAVGDDIEAARLAGIQVNRVLMSVYMTAGFIFAITAWIIIGRVAAASPNTGSTLNLDSITAVVIGGTSLFGGRGAIFGSLLGAVMVGVFRNGLSLAGVDLYYQTFAVGVLILVAVSVDQWIRRARK
jgi:fructose transport system permease protein